MIYQVVLINGKIIEFLAEEYEYEDGTYTFYVGGEVMAQFQRNNIAGFSCFEVEDDEEADE